MTEYKKLAYQMEDTFILGKSLPVVAMRQLRKIADKFAELPDSPDYRPGVQTLMQNHIMEFIKKNSRFMDDERELKAVFERSNKNGHYSTAFLSLFENH